MIDGGLNQQARWHRDEFLFQVALTFAFNNTLRGGLTKRFSGVEINPSRLIAFDSMEMSQYKIAPPSKPEKTIWVCGKCKKDNLESILLGKWKLIDRRTDNAIPCDVCGAGLSKVAAVEPLASRNENLLSRFT